MLDRCLTSLALALLMLSSSLSASIAETWITPLVPAVAAVFPEVPHQLCHTHFLKNCARPLEPDLRELGASVEQRAERVRKLARQWDKEAPPAVPAPGSSEAVGAAPATDLHVARDLLALVKPQAKSSGKAPLAPPELLRHQRLERS